MYRMRLAEKLSLLCDRRGWDQSALVEAIRRSQGRAVSKTAVHNWFNGKGSPALKSGLLLARTLDVSLEYLADDDLDDPSGGVTEEQRRILWAAEQVGYVEAARRIMVADPPPLKPNTAASAQILQGGESSEKVRRGG